MLRRRAEAEPVPVGWREREGTQGRDFDDSEFDFI